MISEAKIYCFSHFMCFYAIIFTYILLIQDAARQCQRCENVVFPLCRCARLSLYFINTGCGSAVSFPSFSGSCMCIPLPSFSRDAKSCVSRSACHSFYCQTVARVFLSHPPVETQDFASPVQHSIPSLSGRCMCIPQPHARETQDFASLLLFDGVYS